MGAYQLFNIEFIDIRTRNLFEEKFKYKRLFQYHFDKEENFDCTYYIGWDGYGKGKEVVDWFSKRKILKSISRFVSVDLTTQSEWWDELNDRSYKKS